jgi:hypothetical protein
MSTSAIVSGAGNSLQSYFQARGNDAKQLGQALSSGNLANAQAAYNSISSLGQNGSFGGGHSFVSQQRQQDFTAIGAALQSGDLAGAQAAFAALQGSFKNGGVNSGPTPVATPVTSGSSSTSGPEIILNLSNTGGSSASPEQITINIGQASSGGGEQISLSVGNQGSNPQQVTFNLAPNSNEQIVLNLLDGSAIGTTATGTTAASGGSNLSVSA